MKDHHHQTLQQSPSEIFFRARSTVAGMMARLAIDTLLVQVHGGDTGQTAASGLLLLRRVLRVLRRHRDWRQVLCVLVRLQGGGVLVRMEPK